MGRARGGRGLVNRELRAKRWTDTGLTRSVCPQEWPLGYGERELAVPQTGRGARHNDPSHLADHQANFVRDWADECEGVVMFNCEAIYPGPTAKAKPARCRLCFAYSLGRQRQGG